ncbi:MAG: hypothetical protein V3S59_04025 [Alphaproteobacteria bacterium]
MRFEKGRLAAKAAFFAALVTLTLATGVLPNPAAASGRHHHGHGRHFGFRCHDGHRFGFHGRGHHRQRGHARHVIP